MIFFRECQGSGRSSFPSPVESAARLGFGRDAKTLARLVPRRDSPRLVAAFVRVKLMNDYGSVKEEAAV